MSDKRFVEVRWSATLHIGGTKRVPLDSDMQDYVADVADQDWEDIDPQDLEGHVSDMGGEWMRPGAVYPVMDWADEAIGRLDWSDADYDEIETRLVGPDES